MSSDPSDRRLVLLLVGLCLFLFFFYLGSRDLWDVDEGMHSVSARYVVESGDWVTPTYNGEAFLDKPMFFTWLVAISFALLGFTETAARLPAAVVGLCGVLVTFFLGRRMFDARTGFLGGSVLATTILYLAMSRTVVHDSALALFTTLALYLFWMAVVDPGHRKACFLLFYVALAGAVLAKGPLGLVLPALVIGPFLLLTRRLGLIREMQLGWGALIFLVLVSPWYILMSLRNEGYLSYFLIEKTFGSFTSEESSHPAPWHFYIPVFLGALLPWSSFLPVAIYRAWRRLAGDHREAILYLLLWVGMMFLFFSVARSKLVTYLLPLMPAVAILIGQVWAEAMSPPQPARRRHLLWSHIPVVVVAIAGCLYLWQNPPMSLQVKYGITQMQIACLLAIVLIGGGAALGFLIVGRNRGAFGSIVVGVMGGLALFTCWIGPTMDPYRSTREMALELDRILPPGEPMVFHWREKDSALFYTDREGVVLPTSQVGEYISADREVFFVSDLRHLHRIMEHRDRFAFVRRIGDKVLISNRPEREQAAAVPENLRQ